MPEGTAITTRGRGTHAAVVHLRDEMPQHRLGHFEVGDDAVLQRTDGDDIGRRAAEHAFRLVADGEHFVRAGLHRHDRRLAQDDALILDVDERVGRAEIDADVVGEPAEKSIKHERSLRIAPADSSEAKVVPRVRTGEKPCILERPNPASRNLTGHPSSRAGRSEVRGILTAQGAPQIER